MNAAIKRHGGKSYLASKIVSLMPPHTRYCEPYFGGGAVLFARSGEGVAEFVNDKDHILMYFWFVLSDKGLFEDFYRKVSCTPFAEKRFADAKERIEAVKHCLHRLPVDIAADFFVLNRQSRQALGRDYATPTSRLRRGMNEQVSAWLSAVDGLPEIHERLRRVEIRCGEATDFIRELDSAETFFYIDPPYLHETRFSTGEYEHEMTLAQHQELLNCLRGIKGKFILSGYPSTPYNDVARAAGWHRIDIAIDNKASGKKVKEKKTECLWMNYEAPNV